MLKQDKFIFYDQKMFFLGYVVKIPLNYSYFKGFFYLKRKSSKKSIQSCKIVEYEKIYIKKI